MSKFSTNLLLLLLVFFLKVGAQNPIIKHKQDSILRPIILENGKAQVKMLNLFTDSAALENLTLEISLPNFKQGLKFVQNPVRIEIEREIDGKMERIEIARFFLPWLSKKLDIDPVFVFDLSDYSSLFSQPTNLYIESNNTIQHLELKVHFIWKYGRPSAKVKQIINLWRSDITGYSYSSKSKPINQQIKNKNIKLSKDIKYALLKIYLSGRCLGNQIPTEAECSKFYFLNINGKTVAKRPVWSDDCSFNALFPQKGPWAYSRANWCPGQALRVYDHFILLGGDTTLSIDLNFQEATESNLTLNNYVLSANLILIEDANYENDAAIVEILAPNNGIVHNRYNPICGSPVIRVRNTGNDTLRTVAIEYGLDDKNDNRYRWRGELAFMEEEIVYLPTPNWYFYDQKNKPTEFSVTIKEVNNKADEYKGNNQLSTDLYLAPVYPNKIDIQFSASQASENIIELVDNMGVPLFEAADFINDSVYNFELDLFPGCYEFIVYDQQGNGISSPNGENGKLKIIDTRSKQELKEFESNFGSEIRQQFMILK
ncbi:MAG: peptide-N-glycosidase F-related protein [Bacteroidales bacterium]|jgi:hypothetical protein|nr:peptide-N-glycosidase F-related protein [Bacteroidales bacterium]